MATQRVDPFAELISPRQLTLNRLADTHGLPPSRLSAATPPGLLPVTIEEAGDQVIVSANLAGAEPESIAVETQSQLISIRANFPAPEDPPPLTFTYRVTCCGPIERLVQLPAPVVVETARIDFAEGKLTVTMKKAPATRVPVQAADG
ncbi:MAG: Hsp20/alpha crystallin family protein [Chloroflexota bacterium]